MSENTTCYTNRTWMYYGNLKIEIGLPHGALETAAAIKEYIDAGFTITPPDDSNGDKLEVRFVVRGQKIGDGGELIDRIYFYKDWGMEGSDMTVYMDDAEDVAKFERASGVTIATLPVWKSKAAPAKTSSDFDKFSARVNFTVTREKQKSKSYPDGRWVVVDYLMSTTPQNAPKQPLNQSGDGGSNVVTLPPPSVQKTPEQLEAEKVSTDNDMPVDYSRNPPPNEKSNRTQWEAWLKRQFTMYKKVRSS